MIYSVVLWLKSTMSIHVSCSTCASLPPRRSSLSAGLSSLCYRAAFHCDLFYTSVHFSSVTQSLHMVVYICQCYSLSPSYPLLPPLFQHNETPGFLTHLKIPPENRISECTLQIILGESTVSFGRLLWICLLSK